MYSEIHIAAGFSWQRHPNQTADFKAEMIAVLQHLREQAALNEPDQLNQASCIWVAVRLVGPMHVCKEPPVHILYTFVSRLKCSSGPRRPVATPKNNFLNSADQANYILSPS